MCEALKICYSTETIKEVIKIIYEGMITLII